MKKKILLFAITLSSTFIYSQNLFEQYDGHDDVNAIIVTQKMFVLMGKVQSGPSDPQTQNYLNLTKKLSDLKVFTTQNMQKVKDMKVTADSYSKASNLTQLRNTKNTAGNITIYTNNGATASDLKELFMFIESPENQESVLMNLKGNFSLSDVSLLIDKMQIRDGIAIKKALNNF